MFIHLKFPFYLLVADVSSDWLIDFIEIVLGFLFRITWYWVLVKKKSHVYKSPWILKFQWPNLYFEVQMCFKILF